MVGAGALTLAAPAADLPDDARRLLVRTLVAAAAAHVLLLLAEYGCGGHRTKQAAAAAHLITRGPYAGLFWTTGVGLAALAAAGSATAWDGRDLTLPLGAGVAVQIALLAYESVFVRAGQDVPLS
jgi:hypothetical protein